MKVENVFCTTREAATLLGASVGTTRLRAGGGFLDARRMPVGPVLRAIGLVFCMVQVSLVSAKEWLGTEDLIRRAVDSNPQILSQKALNRSAVAGVDAARWQFFPTPSVAVEQVSSQAGDPSFMDGGRVLTFRIQQPLYTWGRLTAGWSKAQTQQLASEASLEETRQQVALRVVQACAEWLGASLKLQAYREGVQTHRRFLALITRRISQGVSADADGVLVQGRLAQMQADSFAALAQREAAESRLSQLVGADLRPDMLRVDDALSAGSLLDKALQQWLDSAIQVSPVLARLQAQAKVAELEVQERKAALYPEIYLRAEHQTGNFSIAGARSENRIFVGLSGNFGAGLSGLSQLAALQARYQAALEDFEAGKRNLQEQIMSDLSLLQATGSRLPALESACESALKIVRGGERQFLAGKKSWQELMNMSRELVQAQVQLADAKSTQLTLTWRLPLVSDRFDDVMRPGYFRAAQQ